MDETKPIEELWAAVAEDLPPVWRTGAAATILNGLSFTDALLSTEANNKFTLRTNIGPDTPLDLAIPGLSEFGITIGEFDDFGFTLDLDYEAGVLSIAAVDVPITIYLPDSFLRPVDDDGGVALIGQGTFRISSLGEIRVHLDGGLDLPPCYLGDSSGIIISASGLQLDLSVSESSPEVLAAGFDDSFVGLYFQEVRVTLPDGFPTLVPQDLILKKCVIGSGGVSGELDLTYAPIYHATSKTFTGPGAGDLFGIPFGLERVEVVIRKNSLTKSSFAGKLLLPFFDEPVAVDFGFDLEGNITLSLTNVGVGGLKTVTKPGILSIELDSLGFELHQGVFVAKLSGKLTPLFGGLKWPSFDVKELSIDSKGHVKLQGGWLDLPKQYALNFHGFKVSITKLGMGRNEDGTKWIGFSGSVKMVDGLPAGVSVEGLRITAKDDWSSPKISFNGVGVELDAKAFYFKGSIAYREFLQNGATVRRFDGDLNLKLRSPKLQIDGSLVVGSVTKTLTTPAYNFFAIYVGVELPTGIPLGSTGLGLYGFAGLLAIEMEPDKWANEAWYAIDPAPSWYKRTTIGVADLKKWINARGSKAFGAGVTLGTYADNGYIFSGKILLAIVFPGPIILLEGMANLLKDRAKLTTGEPLFRSLAVLDNRAGSLLIGLDVKYQYDNKEGKIIKIAAGTEAYYKFSDPRAWHIYLGIDEPREQRIQADILALFNANAYLMLNAYRLKMGAWVGFDKSWNFGPLSVTLQAWMENNAVLSFKPPHLYGNLWLHGAVDLKAFSVGLGLTVDARLEAEVFDPFHVLGTFDVGLTVPWPFKKKSLEAHVELEWGPKPAQPPISIALKEVAIEHFKVSTTWPLPAASLLVPDYADADGFLPGSQPSGPNENAGPPGHAPIVALDCRPSLSFSRNVNDDAQVGTIVRLFDPKSEQIGDPTRGEGAGHVTYALREVRLDKWDGSTWKAVAGKGGNNTSLPELFGTWAPIPNTNGSDAAQNKLLLWSKTGFDHTRHTGSEWSDWFIGEPGGYPCLPESESNRTCFDFEGLPLRERIAPLFNHPRHPEVTFKPADPEPGAAPSFLWLRRLPAPVAGKTQGLCTMGSPLIRIFFDRPVTGLRLAAVCLAGDEINLFAGNSDGTTLGPVPMAATGSPSQGGQYNLLELSLDNVVMVELRARESLCLIELCARAGLASSGNQDPAAESIREHNRRSTALWSSKGNVLEPYTNYRLRIVTTADFKGQAQGVSDAFYVLPQLAYFQTKGPPGLSTLTKPTEPPYPDDLVDSSNATASKSGLDDLTLYVKQTIPPTVPKTGELPLLPRPVYRGYDFGVLFNEDYVDLMYRLAGRDLSLLLYDRNNQPVRDQTGRLVVSDNPWGVNEKLAFNAQETPWLSLLAASPCVDPIDLDSVPRDQTLQAAHEAQILDPDTLYDARLMPLLVHEDFSRVPAGTLGRWQVSDQVTTSAPSHWEVEEFGLPAAYRVIQTSAIGVGGTWLGTMLVLGNHPGLPATDSSQPTMWSDYRMSLYLRSSQDGTIGAAFRYANANNFYLFAMDRPNGAHRLLRVAGGGFTMLAEDQITYDPNRDYHLVVEVIGDSLRIYLDDALLFNVTDATIASGGLALQCGTCAGAAFSDIQVHDFSKAARSVYHFPFTTSAFVDFFHHIHSFDDECWPATCTLTDAELTALDARSTSNQNTAISDEEARAFERLADNALGTSANQLAVRTELTRIERVGGGDAVAFLLRTPEPIDWARTSVSWALSGETVPSPVAPGLVKLVSAALESQQPENENITLLVREAVDLTGYRIEKRDLPAITSTEPAPANLDDPTSTWILVYQFGSENMVAPGTQIVINSGNPDNPPPTLPRVLQRFRAAAGALGDLQLAANAVDLRLVDSQGEVLHARRFLNGTTSYSPVAFHVLRKADGTAFFLLPAGFPAAGFSPGAYQMTMTFRRDNTVIAPGSIVLSAAGQKTDEAITLDVPSTTVQLGQG